MKISCIIVDDEPIARNGIEAEIKEIEFLEIVGIAENALQAQELLTSVNPDLVFLDIQMPKLSGLDFLKSLKRPPLVIIITAYSEFALEGFNLDVIDYLVKPVSFSRLLKACHKAKEYLEFRQQTSTGGISQGGFFYIKFENKFEKIKLEDLLFVEAADNYVIIHTPGKNFLTYLTLKNMEEYLPAHRFMKVHKSFIVALDQISNIEGSAISIAGRMIPISRSLKDEVLEKVVNSKLIKR